MRARVEFKKEDCWIGFFWRVSSDICLGDTVDLWICLLPMVPLRLTWKR